MHLEFREIDGHQRVVLVCTAADLIAARSCESAVLAPEDAPGLALALGCHHTQPSAPEALAPWEDACGLESGDDAEEADE